MSTPDAPQPPSRLPPPEPLPDCLVLRSDLTVPEKYFLTLVFRVCIGLDYAIWCDPEFFLREFGVPVRTFWRHVKSLARKDVFDLHRSLASFEEWFETVGKPVHGLAWPDRLRSANIVIVVRCKFLGGDQATRKTTGLPSPFPAPVGATKVGAAAPDLAPVATRVGAAALPDLAPPSYKTLYLEPSKVTVRGLDSTVTDRVPDQGKRITSSEPTPAASIPSGDSSPAEVDQWLAVLSTRRSKPFEIKNALRSLALAGRVPPEWADKVPPPLPADVAPPAPVKVLAPPPQSSPDQILTNRVRKVAARESVFDADELEALAFDLASILADGAFLPMHRILLRELHEARTAFRPWSDAFTRAMKLERSQRGQAFQKAIKPFRGKGAGLSPGVGLSAPGNDKPGRVPLERCPGRA